MARARERAQSARNTRDASAGAERFAARGSNRTFVVLLLFIALAILLAAVLMTRYNEKKVMGLLGVKRG